MVDILMAVYNGEQFVSQQIDSILKQTYQDWRLIILDDCSTDQTMEILDTYQRLYPDKITYSSNLVNSHSPKDNFFNLIQDSQASYVMTCDHDDVWLPEKIEQTLACMQKAEKRFGTDMPILVHTDLVVVDENLKMLSPSMIKSQNLSPNRVRLRELLVQNQITGCTMMLNRMLANLAKDMPPEAVMHDWWYGLIAATFGKIIFLPTATILYRQHMGNQVGAKAVTSREYITNRLTHSDEIKTAIHQTYRQAAAFLERFGQELSEPQREMVQAFAQMNDSKKLRRLQTLFHYRFFKGGMIRKIGQLIYL